MPRSKGRTKTRAARAQAASRAQGEARERRSRTRSKRLWWAVAAVGGVLFLLGNVGARVGLVLLPFDPHHLYTQWGGGILAIVGLVMATRK